MHTPQECTTCIIIGNWERVAKPCGAAAPEIPQGCLSTNKNTQRRRKSTEGNEEQRTTEDKRHTLDIEFIAQQYFREGGGCLLYCSGVIAELITHRTAPQHSGCF